MRRGAKRNSQADGMDDLMGELFRLERHAVVDRRIGERTGISEEERIDKRLAKERSKRFRQRFDLDNEPDYTLLTHGGEALTDVERYDDPRDVSESDDELLDDEYVSKAHFGGSFLSRMPSHNEEDSAKDTVRTRQQIIQELIADSKLKKSDKMKLGEEYLNRIKALNSMLKGDNILQLIRNSTYSSTADELKAEGNDATSLSASKRKMDIQNEDGDKFFMAMRDLKTDTKRARVGEIPSQSIEVSIVAHINWGVSASLIPPDIQIPSTYKQYVCIIDQHVRSEKDTTNFDVQKFYALHDKLIDDHQVNHRGKLLDLGRYILRYGMKIAENINIYGQNSIVANFPYLFQRILTNSPDPNEVADFFLKKIEEAQKWFTRNGRNKVRECDILVVATCLSLFDAKEFRHRILTPALLYVLQVLAAMKVTSEETGRIVLVLCYQAYGFVEDSGKYCPEILHSLLTLLRCFNTIDTLPVTAMSLLEKLDCGFKYAIIDLLVPTLALLMRLVKLYSNLTVVSDAFNSIRDALNDLRHRSWVLCKSPTEYGVEFFQGSLDAIITKLEGTNDTREPLRTPVALPNRIRLYEPEYNEVKRKKLGETTQKDQARLRRKIKKESRGAVRDLKKEGTLFARVKQMRQDVQDKERKTKVNRIIGGLGNEHSGRKQRRGKK